MSYKDYRSFYILLVKIFITVSVVGVATLIYTSLQNDPSQFAFSLIAFVISVAALVMTTLQSLSIARQVRITEKAARLIHETGQKLEYLVDEDRKMKREIREDLKVDQEIVAILEEHGVGNSDEERSQVAGKIAVAVSKRVK